MARSNFHQLWDVARYTAMNQDEIYILVEGNDDERFVEWVLKPILNTRYDYIRYYQYAQRPKRRIEQFIQSIVSRKAVFLCLTDIDMYPCITARKESVKEMKIGTVSNDEIVVVIMEIEGWYLAGLNDACCSRLKIATYDTTDNIQKEQCEQLLSVSKLGNTINCKIEILKNYDIATAKIKNQSFNYFFNKHLK